MFFETQSDSIIMHPEEVKREEKRSLTHRLINPFPNDTRTFSNFVTVLLHMIMDVSNPIPSKTISSSIGFPPSMTPPTTPEVVGALTSPSPEHLTADFPSQPMMKRGKKTLEDFYDQILHSDDKDKVHRILTVTAKHLAIEHVYVAMVLLDRIVRQGREVPKPGMHMKLFSVALMLAHKTQADRTFSNAAWGKILGVPLLLVNRMEREVLACLDWKTGVSVEDFVKISTVFSQLAYRWSLLSAGRTPSNLSVIVPSMLKDGHSSTPQSASSVLEGNASGKIVTRDRSSSFHYGPVSASTRPPTFSSGLYGALGSFFGSSYPQPPSDH